ncbi:MAG TPA: RES family NAD+ phosphorylase [Allosphingosinicella sp.]
MTTPIDENPKVSICLDCARHPSLRANIAARTKPGLCAFCCREDAPVRDADDLESSIMLLRALIRFYWDEEKYNSHWGGDNVLKLFDDNANPVVNPPVADTYLDEFDQLLGWPPYPDYDKGIAVYAGFSDGIRLINFAISRSDPRSVRELRTRLLVEDHADVRGDLDALIDPFLSDLKFTLPKGGPWYRARTGVETLYQRADGFDVQLLRQPFREDAIGASPTPGDGRLNRAGHPVLYLGSKAYTALAEIRPHPGHYVSIGGFETLEDLRIADFDPDIAHFATNDVRLDQYAIIQAFDRMMSTPVTPDDKASYRLTQLLAEVLTDRGYDGVQYRSSVSDGINICLFDPAKAAFVDGHSEVRFVQAVHYDAPASPFVAVPGNGDHEIKPR